MLILTRKVGETIRIGDNVTVRVLALRGGQVSLGFTAPNDVRIFREEVLRSPPATAAPEGAPAARETPSKRSEKAEPASGAPRADTSGRRA